MQHICNSTTYLVTVNKWDLWSLLPSQQVNSIICFIWQLINTKSHYVKLNKWFCLTCCEVNEANRTRSNPSSVWLNEWNIFGLIRRNYSNCLQNSNVKAISLAQSQLKQTFFIYASQNLVYKSQYIQVTDANQIPTQRQGFSFQVLALSLIFPPILYYIFSPNRYLGDWFIPGSQLFHL